MVALGGVLIVTCVASAQPRAVKPRDREGARDPAARPAVTTSTTGNAPAGLARPPGGQANAAGAPASDDIFPLSILWTVALDTPPALAPAYDDDRVFIALKADEDRGHPVERIAAYSLTSGDVKWTRDAPAVNALEAGGALVFACSDRKVEAMQASDGAPRWQLSLDAPLSAPMHAQGGWLFVMTQASHAYAFRASDGKLVWDIHLPAPASAQSAAVGDGLYVPLTDNRVLRLQVETGAIVWDRSLRSQPTCVLALDDRVFVGTSERWFYALSPRNGGVDWRFRVGGAVVGTPSADRSNVYFLALDNLLRALDRSGGSLRWRRLLGHRGRFGPFLVGRLLVVSGASPTIETYAARGGAPTGTLDAPHDLKSMPIHVVPGIVDRDFLLFAVTGEGELLAIRPHSLEPETFALSPRLALLAGWPYWIW